MSVQPTIDPTCDDGESAAAIELIIDGRPRDIAGFHVRRILPSMTRRLVGPFAFLDHMGPTRMPPGKGLDVPPHPHINLATVTYLFEGEIEHRDSLGVHQSIRPGAVNWMTAGRGIVHSERTSAEERAQGARLHGIQLWVALPAEHEEMEPEFHHHPPATLPTVDKDLATVRVLAGSAYGVTSPVKVFSPLFYVDAQLKPGASLCVPTGYAERAAYVAEGSITCGPQRADVGRMLVFAPGSEPRISSETGARVMLLGGAALEGKRHIWWNFVSSKKERIEQAKQDWSAGRFPAVPGDEGEPIPLPE